MDYLEEIINSLDTAEKKEFQHFIQRNKKREGRKDLELFKLYSTGERPAVKEQIRLLALPNQNAYHSTRKRLYAHLSDFAILKANEEDQSAGSRVRGWYSIASHLLDRGLHRLALNMLDKAEDLALKNNLYAELNAIYLLQIQHLHLQSEQTLFELTRKLEKNKKLLESDEKMILFHADLRQNMAQVALTGLDIDLKMILRRLMTQNALDEDITQSPRLLCSVLRTVRDSANHMRQYASFEAMATTLYHGLVDKSRTQYNVEILYMITHAQYRNKRFGQANETMNSCLKELAKCSKTMQRRVGLKMSLLRAANALFLEGPAKAISILEELLNQRLTGFQEGNALVNLCAYHFYNQDFKSAQQALLRLKHTDKWYIEKMGAEWLLKMKLIELLVFHELGEVELFESRMRSIKRKFKSLLKLPKYQRVRAFLKLVETYHQRLHDINLLQLEQQIEISWSWLPKEQEDLQAMMFYAWLKSKILEQDCYQTLKELVS